MNDENTIYNYRIKIEQDEYYQRQENKRQKNVVKLLLTSVPFSNIRCFPDWAVGFWKQKNSCKKCNRNQQQMLSLFLGYINSNK